MSTAALEGVTKCFGSRKVLTDVTMAFAPATRYVITGRSGCGKSTLLNLLAGYTAPDAGQVSGASARGYLFQDELLLTKLTVRQNLAIRLAALGVPAGLHAELTVDALARANVADLIDDEVAHLSGGERQRVQVAMLLVADPALVLMDEPTSKLDAGNRLEIARAVTELFADRTVLIVSHEERSPLAEGAVRLNLHEGRLDRG
jgi:ABC-type multidrug transport system ATPase subunit